MLDYLQLNVEQIRDLLLQRDPTMNVNARNITIIPCTLSTLSSTVLQTSFLGNFQSAEAKDNSREFYFGDLSVRELFSTSTANNRFTAFYFNTTNVLAFNKTGAGSYTSTNETSNHKGILFSTVIEVGVNLYAGQPSIFPTTGYSTSQVCLWNFTGIKILIND